MSRFVSSTLATAASQPHVPYGLFAQFVFDSGTVYLSSLDKNYTFGGNTYIGLGTLAGIADVTETNGMISDKLEFVLSGQSQSLMTTALAENYHGREVALYYAYLDAKTGLPLDTPEVLWDGFADSMALQFQEGARAISLVCENRFLLWNKTIGLTCSDEDQKATVSSTDSYFNQSAAIYGKKITWGKGPIDLIAGLLSLQRTLLHDAWNRGLSVGAAIGTLALL